MVTRRRLLLLALSAAVVLLGAGAWAMWPQTAITAENAAKIQVGMTLTEVEVILGGPARDDTTGPVVVESGYGANSLWLEDVRLPFDDQQSHIWKSDCVLVLVWVDADGRVANFVSFRQQRAAERPPDMLRRWLRL